jgi:hypothetical protein
MVLHYSVNIKPVLTKINIRNVAWDTVNDYKSIRSIFYATESVWVEVGSANSVSAQTLIGFENKLFQK